MRQIPDALLGLTKYNQFVIYKKEFSDKGINKIPIDIATGLPLRWSDRTTWQDADNALSQLQHLDLNYYGLGFIFTKDDPFFFLDIDKCLEKNGWSDLAISLTEKFYGAAVEISTSGTGLHIIGKGKCPVHSSKNDLGLELYTESRFVALTGTSAIGSVDNDLSSQLQWLVNSYFCKTTIAATPEDTWTTQGCPQWHGPLDDIELINRALKTQSTRSVFGNAATFADLWHADQDALHRAYPDKFKDRIYDYSQADAALAQHLAFWTGNNCERIKQLMFQSKLVREKWERVRYIEDTILFACNNQKQWLCDKKINTETTNITVEKTVFCTPEQQIELFKGCVYVRDIHRVLVPGGDQLKPEQFRANFGGRVYILDIINSKTSSNAWEAFTESRINSAPIAHSSCFKPTEDPGKIIHDNGRPLVNIWWPIKTPKIAGDATPFLNHVKKLIPEEYDGQILLSYLAALVQYQGVKFQWAPIIQGMQGNGKTLFSLCIAFAIGDQYTFMKTAKDIAGDFNGFLYKTLFIGIEDIKIPDISFHEVMEALKPMITSERLAIRELYQPSTMRDICCNFILNTNHRDGVRLARGDRRFAPFYTAQQQPGDLQKAGMTIEYFSQLYRWLRLKDGFAIVSNLLHTYQIPEHLNPATKQPAPLTSSSEAAIEYSRGGIEQEILEAVAQEKTGFAGGWISSKYLDDLLKSLGANRKIPLNKRRELLQSLNYDYHPGLREGRVSFEILPDGGRPRLYICQDHFSRHMTDCTDIVKEYIKAQQKKSTAIN